jgi:hypothetical protein
MTNGPDLNIEWYDQYGRAIRQSRSYRINIETINQEPLTKRSTLIMSNLQRQNSGFNECRLMVGNKQDSIKFELVSLDNQNKRPENDPNQSRVCDIVEATCRNGECIPKSVLCNGYPDCGDGSDEQNCGGGNSFFVNFFLII